MTASDSARMHVTIHLIQQATVTFAATELWPLHGVYARFGNDLASFAEEVARRLQAEGYVGYSTQGSAITVIPSSAIKRIDFSSTE